MFHGYFRLERRLQNRGPSRSVNALHDAARLGDLTIMSELVASGADVNKEDPCGHRALTEAFFAEKYLAMQWLLQHGARVKNDLEYKFFLHRFSSRRERKYSCVLAWMNLQFERYEYAADLLLESLVSIDQQQDASRSSAIKNLDWLNAISDCFLKILDCCKDDNQVLFALAEKIKKFTNENNLYDNIKDFLNIMVVKVESFMQPATKVFDIEAQSVMPIMKRMT